MKHSGITQRLAINTTYFKFAVDTWLGKIDDIILTTGAFLFLISSAFLIIAFLVINLKKRI